MSTCPMCGRELGSHTNEHHLVPATYSNRDKSIHDPHNRVVLHIPCHNKIHSVFCEQELWQHYHTIERILEHPEIQKYVKWVRKRPIDEHPTHKETTVRKKKRG